MRPHGTAAELERRRQLAIRRIQDGYSVPAVAEFLGVSARVVYTWHAAYRDHGDDGIKAKIPPPRTGKLTRRQEAVVLTWFRRSPKCFGYQTDLWTARRVTELVRRKWGIEFNWRYMSTWLKRRNITPQKPQRRHRKHDPQAVTDWRSRVWPELKNGRGTSGPPSFSSTNPGSC